MCNVQVDEIVLFTKRVIFMLVLVFSNVNVSMHRNDNLVEDGAETVVNSSRLEHVPCLLCLLNKPPTPVVCMAALRQWVIPINSSVKRTH